MSELQRTQPQGGPIAVLAAAALWGTVGPAQVLGSSSVSPVALGSLRLLLGGVGLLLLVPLLHRGAPRRWSAIWQKPTVGWLIAAGVSTAVYQAAFLSSVTRTGAALATVVTLGAAPPVVGVLARVLGTERLSGVWIGATVAAVAGTALLLLPGASAGVDPAGVILGVLGGACYGIYTVSAKKLLDSACPTFAAVGITLLLGGALLAPSLTGENPAAFTPATLALIGWLGVPATTVAYLLFVAGLRHVTATTAGTLSLAEPLVAVGLGLLVLGERFSALAAVGAAMLFTGLAAVAIPGARRKTMLTNATMDTA
jgi:DME family drug/metabolite transporter